jgi:hypothetical protein
MIAGHFGLAAAVKARNPEIPIWVLMLATQWLDVIFVPLFVMRIEGLTPVSGTNGGYGEVIIHADYTHSIPGALGLSLVLGVGAALLWGKRSGLVVGAVAFSHWLLDLVVHRADMPILPGNAGDLPRLGLGLWRAPTFTAALELALVGGGAWLYYGAARQAVRVAGASSVRAHAAGAAALLAGVVTLVLNALGQ